MLAGSDSNAKLTVGKSYMPPQWNNGENAENKDYNYKTKMSDFTELAQFGGTS